MEEKMLRLSIKDIKIYWFTFIVNFVFWTIMAPAALQDPDIYLMLPIGFGLLIIMIPLGNDIRDGRDILYASLPIRRYKIVAARYLSSVFLTVAAFLWLTLLGLVLERYFPDLSGDLSGVISVESILIIVSIINLIICIYLPIIFRFGFGAVISGGIAITGIIIAGFLGASSLIISYNPQVPGIDALQGRSIMDIMASGSIFQYLGQIIRYHGRGLIITLMVLAIAATLAVSISVSISIFRRKEL
jgi:hypothetical protein